MKRNRIRYITYIVLSGIALAVMLYSAVALLSEGSPLLKSVREHIKSANNFHKDSLYDKAIEPYRRALDMEPDNSLANYNSATNLLLKNYKDIKDKVAEAEVVANVYNDAIGQFTVATENEIEKTGLASIKHNKALVFHLTDSLEMAAEEYKDALRNNPHDDETRYNLAVVLYQLKQNQQNQNQQQQNQEQEQQNQEQQQQNQEQQQQNQEQQQNQDQQQQNQDQQQQNQDNQDKQQQQQPQPSEGEISKEAAERLLEAAMQDEKGVLEKVKRSTNKANRRKLQKNW